jgi:hypothetical protein
MRIILVLAAASITIAATPPVSAQAIPPQYTNHLFYEIRDGQWFVRADGGDWKPLSKKV